MDDITELIKKKCSEYDIDPKVLTPKEFETLKREIEAQQRGERILDSILDDPDVFSRGK